MSGSGLIMLRFVGLALIAISVTGCVTVSDETSVTSGGSNASIRERPSRPSRPANLQPESMVVSAGMPRDTDSNGYVDTIPVVVYLFGDADRYPLPIRQRGEFAFRVTAKGTGARIGQWVFDETQSERAAQDLPPGPGYAFGLRLREGVDKMPRVEAIVTGRYRDSRSEREVGTNGPAEVTLGAGRGG